MKTKKFCDKCVLISTHVMVVVGKHSQQDLCKIQTCQTILYMILSKLTKKENVIDVLRHMLENWQQIVAKPNKYNFPVVIESGEQEVCYP